MLLPPDRCTLHGTSEEVEDGTDGTHMTMNVQLIPMRVRPFLLLRSRHTDPKQIRIGSINGINDSLVVLIRELRLIRRRISHYLQVRIIYGSTLHNQVEYLLRTTHKHHRTTLFLQLVHFEEKQVPASYSFLRLTLSLNPLARLHDAHSIRNQHITISQSISKELILLCGVKRVSIYCVNELFALW